MRLLVISHTPHFNRDEVVVGWGPTVREIDQLATRFATVRHIACLHEGRGSASDLPYAASNVELIPVPPSGAEGFTGKLDVLRRSPTYARTIMRELRRADVVHVRAPAHIALIAMCVLAARRTPAARWFKYAGNWQPTHGQNPSYVLQRWWLRTRLHGGLVTINGDWSGQPHWVRSFDNPTLDDHEIEEAGRLAAGKQLTMPLRLLFVGKVCTAKGTGRALEVLKLLLARGVPAELDVVGDGDERTRFEQLARTLGIAAHVRFLGWKARDALAGIYAAAHVLLFPSVTEGWPKVLAEGMAYGVVPVAGAVGSIPHYLRDLRVGAAVPPLDLAALAGAIERYASDPAAWTAESKRALGATRRFSYGHYLVSVDALLSELRSA